MNLILKSFSKQHFYLILVILIISLPNIILTLVGLDSVVASLLKKAVFFIFSICIVILPLILLKPKYYAWFCVLLLPLLLFETFYVFNYKAPSSEEVISLMYNTNKNESFEFFKNNIIYGLSFIPIILLLIYLAVKIKSNFKLPKKLKLTILITSFLVFFIIIKRDFKIANGKNDESLNERIDLTFGLFDNKLKKIFPLAIFKKMIQVKKGIQSIKNYENNIADFQFNAIKKDTLKQNEIYVLIIGETARKHNFSLYGYDRKTNPKLEKINNITAFSHVYSAANLTSISLPFIVTRATPHDLKPRLNEPAILNAFKESGFKTYWLTNQSAGLDGVFAFYSKLADYYKNVSVSTDVAKFDEDLLPQLDFVLADKTANKKFIVIHTIGSHYNYSYRYPDQFKVFKPTIPKTISLTRNSEKLKIETVNSYDNSILYTDYILSEIIQKIEKNNSIAYTYFVSDHGENLYDTNENLLMHGFKNPLKYEYEIPIIIWNSDAYKIKYPNKIENLKKHKASNISTIHTFHTLLDMANIKYKEENLSKSFANKQFDTITPRYMLNPNKEIIKLD